MKLRIKKTGDVVDAYSIDAQNVETIKVQYFTKNGVLDHFDFNSIEELNNTLEDYKPAEPLIKDEKIRKILRDWAVINRIDSVIVYDTSACILVRSRSGISFDLELKYEYGVVFENIKFEEYYTITELCGEEDYSSARELVDNICEVMDKARSKE